MGASKAWVKFRGAPMLAQMVRTLRKVCDEVIVVASSKQILPKLQVAIYRDKIPHQGPLGGMLVGLAKAKNKICFVSSCDAPLLQPKMIIFLTKLLTKEFDCVMPYSEGNLNPLCAVYRKNLLPTIEQKFKSGLRSVYKLSRYSKARIVRKSIWQKIDPEGLSFRNINTPAQLANSQ